MRVMCTGRVDLSFILRAFAKGADGVFIGGCHLNECNYTTHGNFYALRISHLARLMMKRIGLNPERLSIQFISGGEGNRFAELMNEFSETIRAVGPLGRGEGLDAEGLAFKLAAAQKLVPYVKLQERERFRVKFDNRAGYDAWFGGDECARLFEETIGAKLATSEILQLLENGPRTIGEIAEAMGLSASHVSKFMKFTTRQGLARYDEEQKRYVCA